MRAKAVTFRQHTALRFGGPELAEPNVEEKLQVLPHEKTKIPFAVSAVRELLGEVAGGTAMSSRTPSRSAMEWPTPKP